MPFKVHLIKMSLTVHLKHITDDLKRDIIKYSCAKKIVAYQSRQKYCERQTKGKLV